MSGTGFRARTIRQRITVVIAAASIAGLLLATIAVTAYDTRTFRPRALRDATTLTAILQANAIPTLLFDDPGAARENLATLRNRPEIAAGELFRADGSPFASYRRAGAPAPPGPPRAGSRFDDRRLFLTTALSSDGRTLGWLRLTYDLPTLGQRLPQYATVAAVVLTAVVTTALLILTTLGLTVAGPLRSLAETVGRLTETRDLTLRVPQTAPDEIGALTAAFNRMLETLQGRDAALEAGAAALRESEARLRLALGAAEMQTWAIRLPGARGDGREPEADDALTRLLADVHPEDRPAVELAVAEAMERGRGLEVEFRVLRGEQERTIALRGQALADPEGAVIRLLGVSQDVTDRRRLERQLLQSQKMEAIGNLAGGIAHDFNNLLTGMLGYLAFVQRKLPADTQLRADVDQVERAARRAAALTSQLLSYARRQMIMPSLVDLGASVRGLEPMLRRLIGEQVAVTSDLEPDLWLTRVDPGQLEQVVVNLAVNARDAMPGGGRLTITTRNVVLDPAEAGRLEVAPGEFVRLTVADTGTGIAPEHAGRIFEPFFTTKPQGQGTGLGLAVCYGIVKQAGGELTVQTEPGHGSAFIAFLPRAPAEPVPAAPALDEMVGGRETILLAEDDAAVREMAARTLREVGYQVLEAEDGLDAVRVAGEHADRIHLLLTDVVMPGKGGGALGSELRRSRPELPVLFISGYPDDITVQRGVAEAEAPLLAKPFTPGDLCRAVRRVLGPGSQGAPDPPAARALAE